jgi:hypothetical protein
VESVEANVILSLPVGRQTIQSICIQCVRQHNICSRCATDLSSAFLKQISRAHSDHRTDRRCLCAAKADHGSIAAITAGSSVVLHRAGAHVKGSLHHCQRMMMPAAMQVVERTLQQVHQRVRAFVLHLVWLDTVMSPCCGSRSRAALWNAASPVMEVLLSTCRYSLETAPMRARVPTRPTPPQGGRVVASSALAAATVAPVPARPLLAAEPSVLVLSPGAAMTRAQQGGVPRRRARDVLASERLGAVQLDRAACCSCMTAVTAGTRLQTAACRQRQRSELREMMGNAAAHYSEHIKAI